MPNTVDRRIVEMRFDNKDFEKNIDKTMISLETLQKALQMVDAEKGVEAAKKGLVGLGKAAGSLKTDNLSENVDQISNRFSTLGIIGMAVLQNIGNRVAELGFAIKNKLLAPLNYINQGGLTRAFNLEQANFQLSGLGIEKNDTASYYTEVMDAVLGTAYSYDVAAKAASQLAASDVGVTEKTKMMLNGQEKTVKYMTGDMTKAILGIAGVASMTGSSFEDISQVFTRVAGQGKVMSNDLNSISARGLNAAATLAKYLHTTEADVREMVTKGEIDFKTFSAAMTDAFGEHAKDSTKTFTGALEDVKAALARIGADFYGPVLTAGRDILNSITPLVDVIHDKIQWALDDSGKIISSTAKKISGYFDLITVSGKTYNEEFGGEFPRVTSIVQNGMESIKSATEELKGGSLDAYKILSKYLDLPVDKIKKMAEEGKISFTDWASAMEKYASSGKKGATEVKAYLADLSAEMRKYENIADNLGITQDMMSSAFENFAKVMGTDIDKVYSAIGEKLGKTGEELKTAVEHGELSLTDFRGALNELIKDGAITDEQFHNVIDSMDQLILQDERVAKKVEDAQLVWGGLTATLSVLKDIAVNLGGVFVSLLAKLSPVGNALRGYLQSFNKWIIEVDSGTNKAGMVLDTFLNKLKNIGTVFKNFGDYLEKVKDQIVAFIDRIKDGLSNLTILDQLKTKASEAFSTIVNGLKNFELGVKPLSAVLGAGLFWNFYKMLTALGKSMQNTGLSAFLFGDSFNQLRLYLFDLQNTIKFDHILKLAKGVAILAASMWLLSTIDTKKLILAGAAMTQLINELSMASNWISKSQIGLFNKSSLVALGVSLALLAGSVKILSTIDTVGLAKGLIAIKILLKELSVFTFMMSSENFAGMGKDIRLVAKSLITIAIALGLLVIPIKILGGMDVVSLAKGLGAIATTLLIFAGFFAVLNSKVIKTTGPRINSIAKSLVIFAIALSLLVIPIKILGEMNVEQLGNGLLAIVGALTIFGIFFAMLNSKVIKTTAPRINSMAKSLLIFAVALAILAIPIKVLGQMDMEQLGNGLIAIALALLEFVGFAFAMKKIALSAKEMLAVSAMMIMMAVALNGIAIALATLSSFDSGPGLSTLFASLLILAIACKALNGSIVGAAAMVVIAGALMMLAPAIAILSTLNIKGVLVGLLGLAGAMVLLGGAAIVLAAAWPIFLTGAAILALLGAGVLALGAGMTMLAAAFAVGITPVINGIIALSEALPTVLENLAHAIGTFLEVIVEEIPKLIPVLAEIFEVFATVATEYIPRVAEIGLQLVIALLTAIDGKIEDITILALDVVQKFIDGIASKAGDLAESGLNMILQFLNSTADAIANNGPQIVHAIEGIIIALLETIASAIPVFGDYAVDALEKFRQGLDTGRDGAVSSAKETSSKVEKSLEIDPKIARTTKDTIGEVASEIEQGGKDVSTKAKTVSKDADAKMKIPSQTSNGSNAVKGIISGIDSQLPTLRTKATEVATLVDKIIREKNKIQSPSKVLARTGKYLMQGLIQGIDSLTPEYQNRAENIATTLISSTNSAIDAMNSFSTPNLSGAISHTSDVNLRMIDLQKENDRLANGISQLTRTLDGMTETMNSRSLNNYINIDGSTDPEAFADGLIRSFRLNARTV